MRSYPDGFLLAVLSLQIDLRHLALSARPQSAENSTQAQGIEWPLSKPGLSLCRYY
jgi:hypothetical protein